MTREEHNARMRVINRRSYQKHREKRCAEKRAYRAANPEKVAAANRAWRKANPECNMKKWRKRRADKSGALGSHSPNELQALWDSQRGKCALCKIRLEKTRVSKPSQAHLDHIVPLSKGGCEYAFNLRYLCRTCNCKKHAKLVNSAVSLFDSVRAWR